jgi:DNA repair exonuclease SbcCD ATPase subunit
MKTPGRKRELQAEVEQLRQVIDGFGLRQREEMQAELRRLADELPQLRHEYGQLMAALGPLRAEAAGLAGQHAHAAALRAELQQLQGQRDAVAAAVSEADRLTLALAQLSLDPPSYSVCQR